MNARRKPAPRSSCHRRIIRILERSNKPYTVQDEQSEPISAWLTAYAHIIRNNPASWLKNLPSWERQSTQYRAYLLAGIEAML